MFLGGILQGRSRHKKVDKIAAQGVRVSAQGLQFDGLIHLAALGGDDAGLACAGPCGQFGA